MSTPSIFSAIKKLKSLLTREEKVKWLGIAGFSLCTSLLEVVTASIIIVFAQVLNSPEIGQRYLSKVGLPSNLSSGRVVFIIAITCGVIYCIKNCIAATEVLYQNFSIQKMHYDFKNKLLKRYAQSDYAFYLTRNSAFGIQVVTSDVEQFFSRGMLSVANILSEGVVFTCLITTVIVMNPSLAVIIFAVGALGVFVVSKGVLPLFYRWGEKLQEASMHTEKNLMQFFHAFKEIVLLGKRESFIEYYKIHAFKKYRTQSVYDTSNGLPRMVIELLFVILFVTAVACLCAKHEAPTQMLGVLGGYLYVGFRLMPGLNRLVTQLNIFKSSIPAVDRVFTEYNRVAAEENYQDIPALTFDKAIVLNNISFRYLNVEEDTLSEITLKIERGESIGIVGETGTGKSTLVDIILGLLSVHKGSVLIDNKYPANAVQWHKKIGYVPQAVYLTDDTIEANIAFGEYPDEIDINKLNKAIDDAQLRKLITASPEGTKTIVGERGIRLSGGERQRIAIARALYRNPEVLIFDEATSALDDETEAKLMETIYAVSKNRTVIMIAHRWTTLKNCDRILFLEKNQPLQSMTYQDLLQKKNRALSDSHRLPAKGHI